MKKKVTRDEDAAASTETLCFLLPKWLVTSERPPWTIEIQNHNDWTARYHFQCLSDTEILASAHLKLIFSFGRNVLVVMININLVTVTSQSIELKVQLVVDN